MQSKSGKQRAILTRKIIDNIQSVVQKIIESFLFASNSQASNKRELGLVKLLSHQERVWEDFNTLEDVTVALYRTHDNQKDLNF